MRATGLSLVSIGPSWIEVRGRTSTVRETLDPSVWVETWDDGLLSLDGPLAAALRSAGVPGGARVAVLYESPSAVAQVVSVASRGRAAVDAAQLQVREAFSLEDGASCLAAEVLGEDSGDGGVRTHVLVVADRDDRAQVLFGLLARLGVEPVRMCPSSAPLLREVAHAARSAPDELVLVGLAEACTVIAAGGGGSLRFVRSVPLGSDRLAEVISQMVPDQPGAAALEQGQRVLRAHGVPDAEAPEQWAEGLDARAALARLQPVLQRYGVELKQTVRFGLPAGSVPRVVATGPCAEIAGLARTIGRHAGLEVEPGSASPASEPGSLGLLPRAAVARRTQRVARRWMHAGAAAAAAIMALDAIGMVRQSHLLERERSAFAPQLAGMRDGATLDASAFELEQRCGAIEEALGEALGRAPLWHVVLAELAVVRSAEVQLTEITGRQASPAPALSVRGLAEPRGGAKGAEPLALYLDRLAGSGVASAVALESTSMGQIAGAPARRFEISAKLHVLPDRLAWFSMNEEAR